MKRKDFLRVKPAVALGQTLIASASDHDIWDAAVTPMVRAMLGSGIEKGFTRIGETTDGLFPGDEVSNLNGWSCGTNNKAVRFPYLATYYRTAGGAFIVKRDAVKVKAFAWYGDVLKGKPGELIFSFGLRDRRYDGTPRANDTALLDFPYDEQVNLPLIINGKQLDATSLETSLYSYLPGTGIKKACGNAALEDFVAHPYVYAAGDPDEFLRLFWIAWEGERYPGQVSVPIPDVGKAAHAAFEKVANRCGYDFLETAPSHLHVYGWNCAKGYVANDKAHEATIKAFQSEVEKLKRSGLKLSRVQEAWLFVLQSIPAEKIPAHFNFGGLLWPQNNVDQNNLWLYKPLTEKARKLLSSSVS